MFYFVALFIVGLLSHSPCYGENLKTVNTPAPKTVETPSPKSTPKPTQQTQPPLLIYQLLSKGLNRHIPSDIHSEKNTQWQGGHYSLAISRNGSATVESTEQQLIMTLPLETTFEGTMKTALGPIKIDAQCRSQFAHTAIIHMSVDLSKTPLTPTIKMTLPIPEVNATCNTLEVPIQGLIQGIVTKYKPEWEQEMATQIHIALGFL